MSSLKRGFTLIELLVVVAIIGVLASIALASLTTARNKGADASIKSSLNNTRSQSELFYDSNGSSYLNICTNVEVNNVKSIYNQLEGASTVAGFGGTVSHNMTGATTRLVCNDSAGAWAAQAPLKAGTYYCIDKNGYATTSATNRISSGTDYDCAT